MNYADIFDPTKELEALAPAKEIVYAAPVSHRVVDLMRVMEGSIVGHNITRCSNCNGRIDTMGEHDRFCRHCGYRLEALSDD